MSSRKTYERIPIDPALRARAEQMFAHYRDVAAHTPTTPTDARPDTKSEDSTELLREKLQSLRPKAVETLADLLRACDRGELSVTLQKQLISTLKKNAKREGF